MKMPLFQVIIIGIFGLGAVIGLFVFATYTSTGGKNAVGPVVIWGTLPQERVGSALALIIQSNQDLKTVSYVEKNPATIASDLASAIATRSGPDLVLASQEELLALAKFISPIPFDSLSTSAFISSFIQGAEIFTASGGYYGVPFLVDPLVLFYNRSILSSNGIARPPASWEALTGLVPNIATLSATRQVERGLIALGTYSNVQNARGILSTLFLQTGVPLSARSTNGFLQANLGAMSSGGPPPGQAVIRFYTQFADPSKVSYTWNASLPNSRQAFLVGDLALYLGYASEEKYFREANPNLNFSVAPLPQPATAQAKSAYGRIYALMIPLGATNSAGAYQAAGALSNQSEQAVAAAATGLAPVNLNTIAVAPADPTAAIAYATALYTRGWLSPAPRDTDAVFSGMISNVISGRLTLEVALAEAENSLSAFLQQ